MQFGQAFDAGGEQGFGLGFADHLGGGVVGVVVAEAKAFARTQPRAFQQLADLLAVHGEVFRLRKRQAQARAANCISIDRPIAH